MTFCGIKETVHVLATMRRSSRRRWEGVNERVRVRSKRTACFVIGMVGFPGAAPESDDHVACLTV